MGAICVFVCEIHEGSEGSKAGHSVQIFICMTIRRKFYQMATQHAGTAIRTICTTSLRGHAPYRPCGVKAP